LSISCCRRPANGIDSALFQVGGSNGSVEEAMNDEKAAFSMWLVVVIWLLWSLLPLLMIPFLADSIAQFDVFFNAATVARFEGDEISRA
jgi:hypothetical protein